MKSIDFNFLLTNAAFPTTVMLTPTTLSVELKDFQCDFSLIQNHLPTLQYQTSLPLSFSPNSSHLCTLEYQKLNQKLTISFSLKEIATQGKSQIHELPNTIEKQINSLIFHSSNFSVHLENTIVSLASYGLRIKQLIHESSIVTIPTRNYGEIEIKTFAKNGNCLAMTSKLLTTKLFEHYFEMQRPVNLYDVYEELAVSAEFQVILNDVLKILADQAHKPYTPNSFMYSGLVCTANAYNEIHVCYMKEILIKLRVSSFPYTLEVVDMSFYNPLLMKIRKFEWCLHHAVSRTLKDSDLVGLKNTVNTDKDADICQTLELHKPEHVKNTLIFMLNYSQLIFLFEKVKCVIEDQVKTMRYITTMPLFTYNMLDLKVELSTIVELRFNLTLKMKPNQMGLDPEIDIESTPRRENESERLEKWKKILLLYFRSSVKDYCKGNNEILFGYCKVFLVNPSILGEFIDILKEEIETNGQIEMIWPSFAVKEDNYRMTVKVWNTCGKSTDVIFAIKYTKDVGIESLTNLDPNFVTQFTSAKGGNPIDLLRVAMNKRADEIRTRHFNGFA